ncbi:SDR family NAD(P)-dependent oxidoreductase [Chondromyces apiculatus]|uniref:Probable oxidoreductase n=1 Tax=Chondromyces apiculatus DSM 436 TaxID=1192034 RepID=A0A017TG18_9BACT|nr:SDR family NAD(P)-dependent oxidoreductase [Chondromyces apiculatus]EYF08238.1 putative oxidoreductase [Chondromyces apiculatus DSM 436]
MPQSLGATSTTDDVLESHDLGGKHILVTGVSSGLGIETARALVAHGAHVVGAARDLEKAETATREVRAASAGSGRLDLVELDLASLASVRRCADDLLRQGKPFDVIIANAAVMACPFGLTEDGFEVQFGTNHLGHFVLINRLRSLLRTGARVVSLASSGHRYSDVDLDDPRFEHTPYEPFVAYGRSKTANILFAVELDRRLRERGVRATAVHPGVIHTPLGRHLPADSLRAMVERTNADLVARGKPPFALKTVMQGAATSVWAGVVAAADEVGGRYCENCHVTTRVTFDPIEPTDEGVRPYALDAARAAALWAMSEGLVREHF